MISIRGPCPKDAWSRPLPPGERIYVSGGAERIAALWAAERGVPQVPFAPDFSKHSRAAAPFKRNDKVLATLPRGIIIFPGGGIQDNLFDKARAAGIAVIDRRRR